MKILFLTQTFPLNSNDPTAHYMLDFTKGFSDLGHQVFVVLPFYSKLKTKNFGGIKLITFRYIWPDFLHLLGFGRTLENDQKFKWFVYLLSPFFFICAVAKLQNVAKKYNVDVINAHWILPNGFIAAIVSKLTKIPLIVSLPGSDVYIAKKNLLFKLMTKFVLHQASKITSNSPQLLKDLGVNGTVISYPVPMNKQRKTTKHKMLVATAGRRVEKKGFKLVQKMYPNAEVISDLPTSEFRRKLTSVDIFLALSIRDSKGNLDDASLTILEAMSAGCTVIASNLPGNRTFIKNNFNGFLVNPNKAHLIKSLVRELERAPKKREKIGQAAQKTIADSFFPKSIALKFLRIFFLA